MQKRIETPRKLEEYKNRLLDTGKRNRMINYRETKRTTLRILSPEYDALFNLLALDEKRLSFQRPLDRENDLRAYSVLALMESLSNPIEVNIGDIRAQGTPGERSTTLRNLRAKAKLAMEEQGINFLYLSFGFIEWQEKTAPGAPWLRSPLVMMPVTLTVDSINAPYMLSRYDDDIDVNPTLDYRFRKEFGVELPVFDLRDEASIVHYMDEVERIVDQRGWKLLREVNLGLVSFLKISMYHDLEKHESKALNNPVIRAMCGDKTAVSAFFQQSTINPDLIPPDKCFQVLSADSSQQKAIQMSKAGASFVMQGPPGTGKSQTITNIIAEALADGKRVLFVSEKAAALQVVMRRLQETHLDDFCLSLHSHKANKKDILEQLRKCLMLKRTRIKDSAMQELAQMLLDRNALNDYAKQLHECISPLNESPYDVFGKYASLSDAQEIRFDLSAPEDTTQAQFHMMALCASKLDRALQMQSCALKDNPWRNTIAASADAEYQYLFKRETEGLSDQLAALAALTAQIPACMLAEDPSLEETRRILSVMERALSTPLFHSKWMNTDDLNHGIITARENREKQAELRSAMAWLASHYRQSVLNLHIDEMISALSGSIERIKACEAWKACGHSQILSSIQDIQPYAAQIRSSMQAALESSNSMADLLHIKRAVTFSEMKMLGTYASCLQKVPKCLKAEWFDAGTAQGIMLLLRQYDDHAAELYAGRKKLLEHWQEGILEASAEKALKELIDTYSELFAGQKEDADVKTVIASENALLNAFAQTLRQYGSHIRPLLAGIPIEAISISSRNDQETVEYLKAAKARLSDLEAAENTILERWKEDIFEIDPEPLLFRFTTEYVQSNRRIASFDSYRTDLQELECVFLQQLSAPFSARLDEMAIRCKALSDEWTSDILSIDTDALRLELLKPCLQLFGNVAQCEALIRMLSLQKDALQPALKVFDRMPADGRNARELLEIYVPLTPSFEDADAREAILLLNHAKERHDALCKKEKALLEDWEPEVFSLEAEEMLARFKTDYVGFFGRLFHMGKYNEDISQIRRVSRRLIHKLADAEAVRLLGQIREIRQERAWLSESSEKICNATGVLRTRYHAVDEELSSMIQALSSICTNAVGKDDISFEALRRLLDSIDQVRRDCEWIDGQLPEALHHDQIVELLQQIQCIQKERSWFQRQSGKILRSLAALDVRYSEVNEKCRRMLSLLSEILPFAAQPDMLITKNDLTGLLQTIRSIRSHISALMEHASEYSRIFGNEAANGKPLWLHAAEQHDTDDTARIRAGLEYALNVSSWYEEGTVPRETADRLCSMRTHPEIHGIAAKAAATLTGDRLDSLMQAVQKAILLSENTSPLQALEEITMLEEACDTILRIYSELNLQALSGMTTLNLLDDLKQIHEIQMLCQQIQEKQPENKQLFGVWYSGMNTPWDQICTSLEQVRQFMLYAESQQLAPAFTSWFCNQPENRMAMQAQLSSLQAALDASQKGFDAFAAQFDAQEALEKLPLSALIGRYEACLGGFIQLSEWLDLTEALARCKAYGLGDFAQKVLCAERPASGLENAFKREFYRQWMITVLDRKEIVKKFRRSTQDERISSFCMLDDKQLAIAQQRIRSELIDKYPDPGKPCAPGDEMSILKHELNKKARIMPIRTMFKKIPNLLLRLKPCFMMSPLSVSYFLEADSYHFDMVIFDEASQIFPQDAIGSIMRAGQVIIAGDTRQMPPTNFFSSGMSGNDEDYDVDDEEYEEQVGDSILEEADRILPPSTLLWHYRSRSEQLIAYSNQQIYDGKLITFPGNRENEPDSGVEFVHVPDGYYEAKPKNCNIAEAKRCVQLVREHIERHPERSLGVIAFSEKQQQAILHEIERFRLQNPRYEFFFDENHDEAFFVKNLENVQGDERDTILFSVCYAYTREQKENGKAMAMRFGPLGLSGGERRLNVAITRAKKNVKLISSILPEDLNPDKIRSEGVRMLRGYMEFALKGTAALHVQEHSECEEMVESVAAFIEKNGYIVRKQIGCSGYRIDIAVEHPEIENCFAAAIECDGRAYVSADTARDRDHLRGSILRGMGWNVYRVWSVEWCRNPQLEKQKLLAFIQDACSKVRKMPGKATPSPSVLRTESLVENIQTKEDTGPSDGTRYGFVYGQEANWRDARSSGRSERIRLMDRIRYVVGVEQPLHREMLYRRLAGALGKEKVTASVKSAIDSCLNEMSEIAIDQNGFVTRDGFDGLAVRIPKKYEEQRSVEMISPEELALAVQLVAAHTIGMTSDALIDETARALGYQRKGPKIHNALLKAFDSLVRSGRIVMVDDKVNKAEEVYHG